MYEEIKTGREGVINLKKDLFTRFEKEEGLIHLVMIGTKPDIIKQAPLILELKKRNLPLIIGHTGQHNNYELSQSCQEEFGIEPDFNLNVSGDLFSKYAEIIERLGLVLSRFQEKNKKIIPYVHGDTVTASSSAKAAFLARYAVGHVEAGLRTLTPPKELFSPQSIVAPNQQKTAKRQFFGDYSCHPHVFVNSCRTKASSRQYSHQRAMKD